MLFKFAFFSPVLFSLEDRLRIKSPHTGKCLKSFGKAPAWQLVKKIS
jgi:hypothetical protein